MALTLPISSLLLLSAAISLVLTGYAFRYRSVRGAVSLSILMLAVAVFSTSYFLELNVTSLAAKIWWAKVEYIGIVLLPVAWLMFSLQYTRGSRAALPLERYAPWLGLWPLVTLGLVWSNEWHHWHWSSLSLSYEHGVPMLAVTYGPSFWIHSAYSYVLLFIGTVLLLRTLLRASKLYRLQALVIALGICSPWLANGLYLAGVRFGPDLDPTPFAMTISGLAMTAGMLRLGVLKVAPVAHRLIIDGMTDGILVLNARQCVVDINPAAQNIIGPQAENPMGLSLEELLIDHPDWVTHLQHPAPITFEADIRTATETRHYQLQTTTLTDPWKQQAGQLILIRDISAARTNVRILREARDRAEAGNQAKTQFLATISHELRTPLNAIIGYTEMIQEEARETELAGFVDDLGEVLTASHHLLSLINDMLDYSKLEAGEIKPVWETVDVHLILESISHKFGRAAQQQGNTLKTDIPPEAVYIRADPKRLHQSLWHLLNNANKFTQQGTITLCLRHSSPLASDKASQGYVEIAVIDTGIGIAPEQIETLFDPFTQADSSNTRRYGGTGLGLTMSRQLCELMGGHIRVESEPGVGSTFALVFPCLTPEPMPQSGATVESVLSET